MCPPSQVAALHLADTVTEVKKTKVAKPVTWKIKYLYDGDCAMCLSLMTVRVALRRALDGSRNSQDLDSAMASGKLQSNSVQYPTPSI